MDKKPYELRGYLVSPRSIKEIRYSANRVAELLGLNKSYQPDLGEFLERLYSYGVTIDVIEDDNDELLCNDVQAACIPDKLTIFLTEDTYENALRNDPRTRFTIFHELGHLVLGHSKMLHRNSNMHRSTKLYEDSEWQADQFAAEIIMPLQTIINKGIASASQIETVFGVSKTAANRRYNQLQRMGLL